MVPFETHAYEPLAGAVPQPVHITPHVATFVFDWQALPHWWCPELHVNPHVVPSHVEVELAGCGHAVQRVPHVAVSLLGTHVLLQRWKPASQVKLHAPPTHVGVALAGAVQI